MKLLLINNNFDGEKKRKILINAYAYSWVYFITN